MKISREKTEILLMEYATGALDDACALLVASYITLCPEARNYVRQCETYGGALMEHNCDPVSMHQGSLQNVMKQLDNKCEEQKRAEDCSFCEKQPLPSPITNHINKGNSKTIWRKMASGTCFCNLTTKEDCYATKLIRMAPHARTPVHNHPGTEFTLVLQGSYHDEFGEYQAGELIIIEENISHIPVANKEGCLCLVVTDAPVQFTGSFSVLLNIFMR